MSSTCRTVTFFSAAAAIHNIGREYGRSLLVDFLARYKSRIRATVYGERRVRCALLAARVPGAGAEGQEDTLTLAAASIGVLRAASP